MRQLSRLLRYAAPYWLQLFSSVTLMAAVGLLDAFRVLLIGPIFDRVLNPATQSRNIQITSAASKLPRTDPIPPSQVLFGLIRGAILCRPIALPCL